MQATNVSKQNANLPTFAQSARGSGQGLLRFIRNNPKICFGLGVVFFFVLVALAAPLLTPYGPEQRVTSDSFAPSAAHILGTTGLGQDLFAQLVYGARISLTIGFLAAIGSTVCQSLFVVTPG